MVSSVNIEIVCTCCHYGQCRPTGNITERCMWGYILLNLGYVGVFLGVFGYIWAFLNILVGFSFVAVCFGMLCSMLNQHLWVHSF